MPTIVPDHMRKVEHAERPYFGPKQVRTLKSIKPGLLLFERTSGYQIKIEGTPFQDGDKHWWVKASMKFNEHAAGWSKNHMISLAGHSVVPYTNGSWEQTTWLSRR